MIAGIGLDIIELERIEKLDAKSEKFHARILTMEEMKFMNRFLVIGAPNFLQDDLREKRHLQKREEQESERNAISPILEFYRMQRKAGTLF